MDFITTRKVIITEEDIKKTVLKSCKIDGLSPENLKVVVTGTDDRGDSFDINLKNSSIVVFFPEGKEIIS